ncbi:glutathione S-transferase 1-1-like [Chrysoperla carnea]|uniref:glutathione S-transferase 1-1-like n=1 Tax=Chrysoperla carnea TaxID=189513 RepID=UPI001D080FB2|nr:glutathione S-transferase 1-1-like [Chrysoperla carnea]
MPMKLFHWPPSAPSRCAYLTLKTLGLEFEVKMIDLSEKEQYSPEFLSMNPQHIVPTLEDNGFFLWESRAIACYLVDRYAKTDTLYPRNLEKRAIVNQRLYFDATTLYPAVRNVCQPIMHMNASTIPGDKKQLLNNALDHLDYYLERDDFACGIYLTIADISLYATATTVQAIGWDFSRFKNIKKWIKRCTHHIQGSEENIRGCEEFGRRILEKLQPNQI